MKYHQIIAALTEEPLLITPAAHSSLFNLFQEHRSFSKEDFKALREGTDYCGEAVEIPQMEIIDGIAHIPIGGPIGRGFGSFEKGAGAVDVDDLADEIDQAENDPLVYALAFDIDSPGGMVNGTPETADRILRCDKPTMAFTAGAMCSAAYWIGCACDTICATRSANVGSIGVYCPFLDSSEALKAAGYSVQVFSSGKYKGAGVPGTSLSKDQKEFMQKRVSEIAALFYEHVQSCRPDSQLEDMQGQVFLAQMAEHRGLVDYVVQDKEEAIELLLR